MWSYRKYLASRPSGASITSLGQRLVYVSPRHCIPLPLPLPTGQPLGATSWLSNISRSWSTQDLHTGSPHAWYRLPSACARLAASLQVLDYRSPLPRGLPWPPQISSSILLSPHPLHFLHWPIPLWDYVSISWLSVRSMPLLFIFSLSSTVLGTRYSPNGDVLNK